MHFSEILPHCDNFLAWLISSWLRGRPGYEATIFGTFISTDEPIAVDPDFSLTMYYLFITTVEPLYCEQLGDLVKCPV